MILDLYGETNVVTLNQYPAIIWQALNDDLPCKGVHLFVIDVTLFHLNLEGARLCPIMWTDHFIYIYNYVCLTDSDIIM